MREIKFKIWDKSKGIMYDSIYLQNIGGIEWSNQFIPLQFTGLKDKQGKEIFEGDIIEKLSYVYRSDGEIAKNREGEPYIIFDIKVDERKEFKSNKFRYYWTGDFEEVKWENEYGFLPFADSPDNCGCCGQGRKAKECRVVGNIYENPNYLKI